MERGCVMSGVSRAPLSRRQLLKGGLALAACAWTLRPGSIWAEEPPTYGPDRTRWALLSDTHIADDPENCYRGFYPYRNLQEVTAQIAYSPLDGVVITGDLARLKGEPGAYENLKALLAPVAWRPIHLGLGNHDDRENFFRTFADGYNAAEVVENKHVIATQTGPVRLIVLDTLLNVNALSGKLGAQQRTWLQTVLQMHDDTPTVLFLHHTPNFDAAGHATAVRDHQARRQDQSHRIWAFPQVRVFRKRWHSPDQSASDRIHSLRQPAHWMGRGEADPTGRRIHPACHRRQPQTGRAHRETHLACVIRRFL